MHDSNYGIFAIILSLIAALIAFIITFKISNFFIAPREHWRQSNFAIIMIKLGMAGGAAFWIFTIVVSLFASK